MALRAVLISAFLVPAFVGTASASVSPTGPAATVADQSITLASSPAAIAQAAIDVFGPNGVYLSEPSLSAQVASAFQSLTPAAQQALKTDVLSVATVTKTLTPTVQPVTYVTSCGSAILHNESQNIYGWVLIEWSVEIQGCSNGTVVSNDSYFPNIIETSWGWGFSSYPTEFSKKLSSSDYEAFVNATFSIGEYSFGINSAQSITMNVFGNGSASGSCSGGNSCFF